MSDDPLTPILYALQERRQRATYGAVAEVVGLPALFLMRGRPRDPIHSWVVNARTGLPTGYTDDATHPDLLAHDRVVHDADALRALLDRPAP